MMIAMLSDAFFTVPNQTWLCAGLGLIAFGLIMRRSGTKRLTRVRHELPRERSRKIGNRLNPDAKFDENDARGQHTFGKILITSGILLALFDLGVLRLVWGLIPW